MKLTVQKDETHVAITTLEQIKKTTPVRVITLTSLYFTAVHQWITDSFLSDVKETIALSEIVYQKTQGNPFYVKVFLRHLLDDGVISLNKTNRKWEWNLEDISKTKATDNVVELLVLKIAVLRGRC